MTILTIPRTHMKYTPLADARLSPVLIATTNQGVGSSNLSGRADGILAEMFGACRFGAPSIVV
jgi:hypothetical protein